tara:strand:+ start:215 stop:586 length:372 start_codon:yes stop_codon:yes gene_type:complete
MIKKLLSILVLGLLLSGNAKADNPMKYGEFKELIQSDYNIAKWYVRGLNSGNLFYSTFSTIYLPDNKRLFCQPQNLKITIKYSIKVIKDEAERLQKNTQEDIDDMSVPLLFILGMQEKYPCEN